MCPPVGCYGDTYLPLLLGRCLTCSARIIAQLAAYYHVWTTDYVWWPQCIDRCPPYSSGVGCRYALQTIAAAQQLHNYLDYLVDSEAANSQLFCHGYILSVVVAQ
jgi:hypothetical protein